MRDWRHRSQILSMVRLPLDSSVKCTQKSASWYAQMFNPSRLIIPMSSRPIRLLKGSAANSTINPLARLWVSGRIALICAVASGDTLTRLEFNNFRPDAVFFYELFQCHPLPLVGAICRLANACQNFLHFFRAIILPHSPDTLWFLFRFCGFVGSGHVIHLARYSAALQSITPHRTGTGGRGPGRGGSRRTWPSRPLSRR